MRGAEKLRARSTRLEMELRGGGGRGAAGTHCSARGSRAGSSHTSELLGSRLEPVPFQVVKSKSRLPRAPFLRRQPDEGQRVSLPPPSLQHRAH